MLRKQIFKQYIRHESASTPSSVNQFNMKISCVVLFLAGVVFAQEGTAKSSWVTVDPKTVPGVTSVPAGLPGAGSPVGGAQSSTSTTSSGMKMVYGLAVATMPLALL